MHIYSEFFRMRLSSVGLLAVCNDGRAGRFEERDHATQRGLSTHSGRQIRLSVLTRIACAAGAQVPNNE
jgi:hypothetical protein